MLKKYLAAALAIIFLSQTPAYADHWRGPVHGFRGEHVVHRLPLGYVPLLVGGLSLLYCEGLFYRYTPAGYVVAAPPVTAPPPAPQPAPPATAAKTKEPNHDVYDIYIPNGNGSYTSMTLRKTEKGFLGPQGEFYADHSSVEQLRERYTKK